MTRGSPRNNLPYPSDPFSRARVYAPLLWFALGLFCLRVVGQLLVATLQVGFLPPMEEWYSGLMPYPPLLVSQLVIIGLFGNVCLQFSRGRGWLVRPRARLGDSLFVFGAVYLVVMVLRYGLRMGLYPPERWVGGSIPIFFHWVLASFILLIGLYQSSSGDRTPRPVVAGQDLSSSHRGHRRDGYCRLDSLFSPPPLGLPEAWAAGRRSTRCGFTDRCRSRRRMGSNWSAISTCHGAPVRPRRS